MCVCVLYACLHAYVLVYSISLEAKFITIGVYKSLSSPFCYKCSIDVRIFSGRRTVLPPCEYERNWYCQWWWFVSVLCVCWGAFSHSNIYVQSGVAAHTSNTFIAILNVKCRQVVAEKRYIKSGWECRVVVVVVVIVAVAVSYISFDTVRTVRC